MPTTKVMKQRGAIVMVEAHGEVLFAPAAPVDKWMQLFEARVKRWAREYAPRNKRPRWAHYTHTTLKNSFDGRTLAQPIPNTPKVSTVVGSNSPHAIFVEKGTGIHAGGSPYEAKILPPWTRGSPSLYEASWVPSRRTDGRRVQPVYIKGQKGQFFMQRALERTMLQMLRRSYQLRDAGVAKTMEHTPAQLLSFLDFSEQTSKNPVFRSQLKEWRKWRDAVYANKRRYLAPKGTAARERAEAYRKAQRDKSKADAAKSTSKVAPKKSKKRAVAGPTDAQKRAGKAWYDHVLDSYGKRGWNVGQPHWNGKWSIELTSRLKPGLKKTLTFPSA